MAGETGPAAPIVEETAVEEVEEVAEAEKATEIPQWMQDLKPPAEPVVEEDPEEKDDDFFESLKSDAEKNEDPIREITS
jgi:hypothetical protein